MGICWFEEHPRLTLTDPWGAVIILIHVHMYKQKRDVAMRITEVFKALSDPTRRKIVEALKEADLTPSELLERIPVSQPTLSHHLDRLKRAGLVRSQREGQYIRYSLDMSALDLILEYLVALKTSQTGEDTP